MESSYVVASKGSRNLFTNNYTVDIWVTEYDSITGISKDIKTKKIYKVVKIYLEKLWKHCTYVQFFVHCQK